ncbi:MAG TPA: NDP-sugar synthase [Pyrinomonadaceae bacterium]|nr:NDP-sugar synthase [Pyrinomonadaceae bacterium]
MPIKFDDSRPEGGWARRAAGGGVKGAILAAGLGRRMEPLSARYVPKPLFPLGGKVPMAEVWLRALVESGVTDVSMNVSVLSETVKRHFRDGAKFGARVGYVHEKTPSGTLGGVCKLALGSDAKHLPGTGEPPAIEPFGGSTVIAPSGDIVTNFGAEQLGEMYELHKRTGAAFTMVLVPIPWERRKDFGTVILDAPEKLGGRISGFGRIKDFFEKDPDSPSNLNNASIYMVEMELLKTLDALRTEAGVGVREPFYDFGKHVFPALIGRTRIESIGDRFPLVGVQYDGLWFDVGQKRDYITVNESLLDGELNVPLPYERLPWGYLGANVEIDFAEVNIVPPVVIGNDCVVEPGATVGPYAVVGDGWRIGSGARVSHSVLWERYPYHDEDGRVTTAGEREAVDRHSVGRGVTVERSIVAGGEITSDVSEQTVEVDNEGRLRVLSIDYVPEGPRA